MSLVRPDVLPLCMTRSGVGSIEVTVDGVRVRAVPTYCMNCGKERGVGTPPPPPGQRGYVGYLCDDCAARWSSLVGVSLTPDAVYARRAQEAMLNEYGRVLSIIEQAIALDDVNSVLSRFARSA